MVAPGYIIANKCSKNKHTLLFLNFSYHYLSLHTFNHLPFRHNVIKVHFTMKGFLRERAFHVKRTFNNYFAVIYFNAVNNSALSNAPPAAPLIVLCESPTNFQSNTLSSRRRPNETPNPFS